MAHPALSSDALWYRALFKRQAHVKGWRGQGWAGLAGGRRMGDGVRASASANASAIDEEKRGAATCVHTLDKLSHVYCQSYVRTR